MNRHVEIRRFFFQKVSVLKYTKKHQLQRVRVAEIGFDIEKAEKFGVGSNRILYRVP